MPSPYERSGFTSRIASAIGDFDSVILCLQCVIFILPMLVAATDRPIPQAYTDAKNNVALVKGVSCR